MVPQAAQIVRRYHLSRRAIYPASLFLFNAYLCHELFSLEYGKFMRSIEAAFISISRHAMHNWSDLNWFSQWYGGIPYQNTYPPLLHWTVAIGAQLFGTSPAHAYHVVTAFFYCLAPVTLYWLAVRLSGSHVTAFCGGLFYSLAAPAGILIRNVREDLGTPLGPRRLQTLVMYGDGPHVTTLALVPLAIICLDLAVTRRKPVYSVLASIAMAAVASTNWLGAFALALAVGCYLLAYYDRPGVWLTTVRIGLLAYLLACPWIPPSTIGAIQFNSRTVGGDYRNLFQALPLRILIGVAMLLLLKLVLHRYKLPSGVQFTWFYALLTGTITLCAEWAHLLLVPQPERYHLDMDQAFVLAAFCTMALVPRRMPAWANATIVILVLFMGYSQIHRFRRSAREWIQPIDITATTEYKIARWMDRNMDARVMAPGSSSYWMNAFTDTPQLGGGFDQGVINRQDTVAQYIICSGDGAGEKDAEIAILWLRAFGVRAIAVAGPHSGEGYYKPFRNPDKFDGVLPLAWHDGEDRIYFIPALITARSASLAYVVRRGDLVNRTPLNGIDVDQIRKYVTALDSPAGFRWTTHHSAEIAANLLPDQIISLQESYHPGWHAAVNGSPRKILADKLGLIAIEPQCNGACTIELIYDGGLEMRIARWLSLLCVVTCLVWIVMRRRDALPSNAPVHIPPVPLRRS